MACACDGNFAFGANSSVFCGCVSAKATLNNDRADAGAGCCHRCTSRAVRHTMAARVRMPFRNTMLFRNTGFKLLLCSMLSLQALLGQPLLLLLLLLLLRLLLRLVTNGSFWSRSKGAYDKERCMQGHAVLKGHGWSLTCTAAATAAAPVAAGKRAGAAGQVACLYRELPILSRQEAMLLGPSQGNCHSLIPHLLQRQALVARVGAVADDQAACAHCQGCSRHQTLVPL
mmetsp:Transcript_29099/g.75288  ORF Transcript_29099/g.75288 Transcript_29099/m.75288 type:complete len:229 (+) Transcript_29099:819-1505(+)